MNETNLIFQPRINILRISHRKIKKKLGWLVLLFLFLFGLYGIYIFFSQSNYSNIFYSSLLGDMFLFYLGKEEKKRLLE